MPIALNKMLAILSITLPILAIDQLSKFIILKNFYPGQSYPIIKDVFHLTLVLNKGAAFGILSGYGLIFIWTSIICVTVIVYILSFLGKIAQASKSSQIFLSLILAGAIGNLVDRIRFGHVVDFLDFRIWPVFNIADSAITIGVFLTILEIFRKRR